MKEKQNEFIQLKMSDIEFISEDDAVFILWTQERLKRIVDVSRGIIPVNRIEGFE